MPYKAFISYSHAADEKLAPAIQDGLQRIAKPFYRLRAMRVFRDETNLQANPALWTTIQKALSESDNFILMASPEAAKSKWVQAEIDEWLKLKNNSFDNLSIVLTDGAIVWDSEANEFDWEKTTALSSKLKATIKSEPSYVDFRWARDSEDLSLRNSRFLKSIGKLAAAVRGEQVDALVGEDVRQHRRFKFIAKVIILALLILSISTGSAAYYAFQQANIAKEEKAEADRQRDEAIKARNEAKEALDRETKAREGETQARELAEIKRKEAEQATKNEKVARNLAEDRRQEAEHATENEKVARNLAEDRRREAETQTIRTNDTLRATYLENGRQQLLSNYPISALAYLNAAYQIPFEMNRKDKISNLLFLMKQSLKTVDLLKFSLNHLDLVSSAEFSNDGGRVVTVCGDGTAKVWSAENGSLIVELKHQHKINTAKFSPDGNTIVTADSDKTARIWEAKSGKQIASFVHQDDTDSSIYIPNKDAVVSAEFSPDGDRIATAFNLMATVWEVKSGKIVVSFKHQHITKAFDALTDQLITDRFSIESYVWSAKFSSDGKKVVTRASGFFNNRVWDIETGKEISLLVPYDPNKVVSEELAVFSPDGKQVAISYFQETVRVWDLENKQILASFDPGAVWSMKFSPDGSKILTTYLDGTLAQTWDWRNGKLLLSLEHQSPVLSGEFSPDGKKIVTASQDRTAKVWEAATGMFLLSLEHQNYVQSARFSPDGKKVVTTSDDHTAKIWDVETKSEFASFEVSHTESADFSSDGERVLISSIDNAAKLLELRTGKVLANFQHQDRVRSAEFSPNEKTVLTVSYDGIVKVWNITTGKVITSFQHPEGVYSAEFSPDGKSIVIRDGTDIFRGNEKIGSFIAKGNTVIVWNIETGKIFPVLKHQSEVTSAEFSPNEKNILTACGNISQIWDIETGTVIKSFNHQESLESAEFSPDGGKILTISYDTVKVWDIEAGSVLASFTHQDAVFSARFSPDGTKIATGSQDETARVWDIKSGKIRFTFEHQATVTDAVFSPDGKRIVTTSQDKTAKIWDIETGKVLASFAHADWVNSAEFSSDGNMILTSGSKVRIWELTTETRTQEEIRKIVNEKVPFLLVNGVLVPR
jgi:WD40 repeat protein